MATEKTEEKTVEKTEKAGEETDVEKVETEAPDTDDEAVEKAMGAVKEMVEGIIKKADKKADDKADDKEDEDTEKAGNPRALFKSLLTKAGLKGKPLTAAMGEYDKMIKPIEKNAEEPAAEEKEVEKKVEATDEEKLLNALETSISKAKRFTPGRMTTLKAAIDTLQNLMTELTPAEKKIAETSEDPATGNFESAITKALENFSDGFKEKLEEMVETQKSATERLDKIEKRRNPSASLEDDGDTDTDTVKTEKSLWADVL